MQSRRTLLIAAAAAGGMTLVLACGGGEDPARSAAPPADAPEASAPAAAADLSTGEVLLARLQCLSCHAAAAPVRERVQPLTAPLLASAGARLNPDWIRRWLADPHPEHSASRMPDLLHGLPEPERAEAIADLTHFLAAQGGPFAPQATRPDAWRVEEGERLFQRLGCFACHTDGQLAARDLAGKTDHAQLAAFLRDPHAQRPGGAMPDFALSAQEAADLAAWLLREQFAAGPLREDLAPGVRFEYFEMPDGGPGFQELADLEDLTPRSSGLAPEIGLLPDHREDQFGYRFSGWLTLDAPAALRFGLNSDDGTDLTINGEVVVANDGHHAPQEKTGSITLPAGRHALQVRMFEAAGGETLEAWMERDGRRETLGAHNLSVIGSVYAPAGFEDLDPQPERVARGRERFQTLGCASCHDDLGVAPRPAAALAALQPDAGCLAESPPAGAARYRFAAAELSALRAVVAQAAALEQPLTPAQSVARTLPRLGCVACHARSGLGGPDAAARARFTGDGDVGDEGRIPPDLSGAGAKLRPEWMAEVLAGRGAVRFYVHARMPRFAPAQVQHLPAAFAAADPPAGATEAAPFSAEAVEAGRALAGAGGLNCIQCHQVAGHAAQGMQTMDLQSMHRRLQPAWFRKWLLNPIAMRPSTRMPVFYAGGRAVSSDILGGVAERQIGALWSWLALGEGMPLPPGLVVERSAYDLVPVDRPIYVGAFMQDGSARVVNVGFPERVAASFDFEHARLMQVWRGDFFNAEGTWNGRAGALEVPAGEAVRPLPPGPSFARLSAPDTAWPELAGREAGWRVVGHRRDAAGRPTYRYRQGGFAVEESIEPQYAEGGPGLIRRFRVTVPAGEEGWHLRADLGGAFRLTFSPPWQPITRSTPAGEEILLPLPRGDGTPLEIEVNLQW